MILTIPDNLLQLTPVEGSDSWWRGTIHNLQVEVYATDGEDPVVNGQVESLFALAGITTPLQLIEHAGRKCLLVVCS